jgi:hypothetical protein
MPPSRRARKTPPRARKAKRRAGSNLISLLLDIEQPLQDATHTVEALRLVGHGLVLHDSAGGDAVAELARIAAERLQVVEDMWKNVLKARRRGNSRPVPVDHGGLHVAALMRLRLLEHIDYVKCE